MPNGIPLGPKQWARVKQSGAHGLRRGAWYAVVNNAKPDLVILDVHKHNVPVPRGLVEVSDAKPSRWSVVQWQETDRGAQRVSESELGMIYAVCPACRARAPIEPDDAQAMKCPECGRRFEMDWEKIG